VFGGDVGDVGPLATINIKAIIAITSMRIILGFKPPDNPTIRPIKKAKHKGISEYQFHPFFQAKIVRIISIINIVLIFFSLILY
jgi:hypothetical protein